MSLNSAQLSSGFDANPDHAQAGSQSIRVEAKGQQFGAFENGDPMVYLFELRSGAG